MSQLEKVNNNSKLGEMPKFPNFGWGICRNPATGDFCPNPRHVEKQFLD
jgi:hypothetical protein